MLVFVILQLCSKLQELSLYKLLHLLVLLLLCYFNFCLFAYLNTTRRTKNLHPRFSFSFIFTFILGFYYFPSPFRIYVSTITVLIQKCICFCLDVLTLVI